MIAVLWQSGRWWHGICLECLEGPPADPDPQRVLWPVVSHVRHHHPGRPDEVSRLIGSRLTPAA